MAGADPELSDAGKARAAALAVLLKDAKITAIFTTEYKRTRDTAQPLAAATRVATAAIDSKDAAGLIDKVKARPETSSSSGIQYRARHHQGARRQRACGNR